MADAKMVPLDAPAEEVEDDPREVARAMLEASPANVAEMGAEDLGMMIKFVHGAWCTGAPGVLNAGAVFARNQVFFGLPGEVAPRFDKYKALVHGLKEALDALANGPVPYEGEDYGERLAQIAASVFSGYEAMVQVYRQCATHDPGMMAQLPTLEVDTFFQNVVEDDYKPHQVLILYYLEACSRMGLRRHGSDLYKPRYTPDGYFTHTMERYMGIEEFIYHSIFPYDQHKSLFAALTSRANVARHCCEYLEHCRDHRLPALMKNRCRFAFLNGVYDAETDVFAPYGEVKCDDRVCAKYFPLEFDNVQYEECIMQEGTPLAIPTPNIQKIFDTQEFAPEVCLWLYASLGRLIFPVGYLDNWQYFPFCKGTAGSGKSTLLQLASEFFESVDVGNLMSEGQKTFSLEHLYKHFVFFCMDVDDRMNFSHTRWNQMVSGEMLTIERKHKMAIQMLWTAGGAFAGNSYPPWVDQGGNVARRMLIFLYTKVVTKVDPQMKDKCQREMAAFLKKCVACYHYLRHKHGSRGIWDRGVLPDYFHRSRQDMQAQSNPLQSFVMSECKRDEEAHVDFATFRNSYNAYCDRYKLSRKPLTADFCQPVFVPHNILLVDPGDDADPDEHFGYSGRYILGASVR